MGRAEDLFRLVEQEGFPAIEALIADRASEELFLEFKNSADDGQGNKLHDRDRNNLKKAIGGFANSEGGVVIWGVECSRTAQAGDVAESLRPLTNPKHYVSWLEGAVSGCTVPPVIGVRSIGVETGSDLGYVVTLVPQSTHAPHQIAGEGKYVIRAGSDFVPAPHGVVAGLFGRPPHPVVFPMFILSPLERGINDGVECARAGVTIVIANNGQVVAEDLFVSVCFYEAPGNPEALKLEPVPKWEGTSGMGRDFSWICPRDFRLAPGGQMQAIVLILTCTQSSIANLRWSLTVGCKGAIPYSSEMFTRKVEMGKILNSFFFALQEGDQGLDGHGATQNLLGLSKVEGFYDAGSPTPWAPRLASDK